MRLINVESLQLEEFLDENAVPYAILSHRWEEQEVTFRDLQNIEKASTLKGFEKIQNTCNQASQDGYQYAWVDTCCINKESSAELSEAINSMFRWYQNSGVCYAFLSDVESLANFSSSSWFTRGWTLQELIAPSNVLFFDTLWRPLGNRIALKNALIARCGVASLWGIPLTDYSVAQRMSWASNRVTTRPEDMAYCMLGIFGVNMPLLYGEGDRAFIRLQEEIIKQVDDQTIFAWPMLSPEPCGLLAPSPRVFEKMNHMSPVPSRKGRSAYSITNRGLNIKLLAKPFIRNVYVARLVCSRDVMAKPDDDPENYSYAIIFLRRCFENDQYVRVSDGNTSLLHEKGYHWRLDKVSTFELEVNVRQVRSYQSIFDRDSTLPILPGFLINEGPQINVKVVDSEIYNLGNNLQFVKMLPRSSTGIAGELRIHRGDDMLDVRLFFGHDLGFNPVCYVSVPRKGHPDKSDDFVPPSMYQRKSWSPGLLHGVAKREVNEWLQEGSDIWLVKGDRISGMDFKLFRQKEKSMVGHINITNAKTEENSGFSCWSLGYSFPSLTSNEPEVVSSNNALMTKSSTSVNPDQKPLTNHQWLIF